MRKRLHPYHRSSVHSRAWLLAAPLFAVACTASAQVDQGTLTGTIKDPSGAVISGAQVTITNVDTGFTLTDKSDSSGTYTFFPSQNRQVHRQGGFTRLQHQAAGERPAARG